jgi:hypothetical protein
MASSGHSGRQASHMMQSLVIIYGKRFLPKIRLLNTLIQQSPFRALPKMSEHKWFFAAPPRTALKIISIYKNGYEAVKA